MASFLASGTLKDGRGKKEKNRDIIEISTGYSIKGESNHMSKIVHV